MDDCSTLASVLRAIKPHTLLSGVYQVHQFTTPPDTPKPLQFRASQEGVDPSAPAKGEHVEMEAPKMPSVECEVAVEAPKMYEPPPPSYGTLPPLWLLLPAAFRHYSVCYLSNSTLILLEAQPLRPRHAT